MAHQLLLVRRDHKRKQYVDRTRAVRKQLCGRTVAGTIRDPQRHRSAGPSRKLTKKLRTRPGSPVGTARGREPEGAVLHTLTHATVAHPSQRRATGFLHVCDRLLKKGENCGSDLLKQEEPEKEKLLSRETSLQPGQPRNGATWQQPASRSSAPETSNRPGQPDHRVA